MPHQNRMPISALRFFPILTLGLLVVGIPACNNANNPDEIRQRTAEATETMRRDTKAVVEGVKEGMGHDGAVNINRASREQLLALPGVSEREADRIMADRPFNSADDLVKRRIVTQAEYDKIRDRVIAGN
jgi:competence protein ComEA